MNKREFASRAAAMLREANIRKRVSSPKHVFHISDDSGNSKDFIVQQKDKSVLYNFDDVDAVLTALIETAKEALKSGDSVVIRGFGALELYYKKPHATVSFRTKERYIVPGKYVVKFTPGDNLKICAKVYEEALEDKKVSRVPPPPEDNDNYEVGEA